MVAKSHNVNLIITNYSRVQMIFKTTWFDSGCLADGDRWSKIISKDQTEGIICYESDGWWSGCSGYVTYTMSGTDVTIAFSNPASGSNKLGVGTNGKGVWDNMSNHEYTPFVIEIVLSNGAALKCDCKCSGGNTNTAMVTITHK